jgi:hypothetical protein
MLNRFNRVLVVALALFCFAALIGAWRYWQRRGPTSAEVVEFVRAVHAFSEVHKQDDQPLQVSQLLKDGYITADTARRFDGVSVTIPARIGAAPTPEPLALSQSEELVRVRLPDHREAIMFADGSISLTSR